MTQLPIAMHINSGAYDSSILVSLYSSTLGQLPSSLYTVFSPRQSSTVHFIQHSVLIMSNAIVRTVLFFETGSVDIGINLGLVLLLFRNWSPIRLVA